MVEKKEVEGFVAPDRAGKGDFVVSVWDDSPAKTWPSPKELVELGVPLHLAERYRRVRRDMTRDLKRRTVKNRN